MVKAAMLINDVGGKLALIIFPMKEVGVTNVFFQDITRVMLGIYGTIFGTIYKKMPLRYAATIFYNMEVLQKHLKVTQLL